MRSLRRAEQSRLEFRAAVALVALACVLVLLLGEPTTGTAVQLHGADDVTAVVRADHHATTRPEAIELAVVVVPTALAVVAVRWVLRALRTSVPVRRFVVPAGGLDAGLPWRSAAARRGPPALV